MAITLTRAAGLALGTLLRSEDTAQASGPLFEASVGLWITGPAITPEMVLGDFTAAAFTGYAALTARTWGASYIDQTGKVQLASPVLQWVCTATGTPVVVLGYYIWSEGTPDVLIAADQFEAPITISTIGDGIAFIATIEFDLNNHGGYTFMP